VGSSELRSKADRLGREHRVLEGGAQFAFHCTSLSLHKSAQCHFDPQISRAAEHCAQIHLARI
jgi:hypothetical protein